MRNHSTVYLKQLFWRSACLVLFFVFSATSFSSAERQAYFAANVSGALAFNPEISNGHWEQAATLKQIQKATDPGRSESYLLFTEPELSETDDDHDPDDDDLSSVLPAWRIREPATASQLFSVSSGAGVTQPEKRPLYLLHHAWKSFLC